MRIHHDHFEYLYISMEYYRNIVNIKAPGHENNRILRSLDDLSGKA